MLLGGGQDAAHCPTVHGQPSPAQAHPVRGVHNALLRSSGLQEKSPEVALSSGMYRCREDDYPLRARRKRGRVLAPRPEEKILRVGVMGGILTDTPP